MARTVGRNESAVIFITDFADDKHVVLELVDFKPAWYDISGNKFLYACFVSKS